MPEPTRLGPWTTATCTAVLVVAMPAVLWLAGSAVFNTAPTSGSAFIELDVVGPASGDVGPSDARTLVVGSSSVQVESQDERISAAWYLDGYVLHALGLLLVALAVVVAVAVLRRRPASRSVAIVLGVLAMACAVSAVSVPRARLWAMQETIERYALPTTLDEARAAGARFQVVEPTVDGYAWTLGLLGCAALALGASLWVLHLRRVLERRDDRLDLVGGSPTG